jgi:DNA-binding transcriptional ArsR family regulator
MNDLNQTFTALADPTRRAILARLAKGETTVGELSRPFDISAPAISRHLKVLESAALITNERRGKQRFCQLRPDALVPVAQWIASQREFWTGSLDRLDARIKKNRKA